MKAPIEPYKLPEVEFEVIKEDWNEYELEDGSILRFKLITLKVFKYETESGKSFGAAHTNIITVRSPERSKPNPPKIQLSKIPKEKKVEVKIKRIIHEDWNKYIIKDGSEKYIFEVKPVITKIYKVKGYYDPAGYPIYEVFSENVGRPIEKIT